MVLDISGLTTNHPIKLQHISLRFLVLTFAVSNRLCHESHKCQNLIAISSSDSCFDIFYHVFAISTQHFSEPLDDPLMLCWWNVEWRVSIVDENVLFQDQSARTSVIQDRVGGLELLQSGRPVFPLAPSRIPTLTPKPNSNSAIALKHLGLVLLLVHLPISSPAQSNPISIQIMCNTL